LAKKKSSEEIDDNRLAKIRDGCLELMGWTGRKVRTSKPVKETRMARAWKEAARDLGIEFKSPFRFSTEDGHELVCSGLLVHFGGPRGTLIISGSQDQDVDKIWDSAESLGFYSSALNPIHYEKYKRKAFIDTLNDWGWHGPSKRRPKWFLDASRCGTDHPCEACDHRYHSVDPSICSAAKPCDACRFYKARYRRASKTKKR